MFLAATALAAALPAANAVTYTFSRITSNASTDIAAQLTMDVTSTVAGYVDFTFHNAVGTASSITEIYVDDGYAPAQGRLGRPGYVAAVPGKLGAASIAAQVGTVFTLGSASPSNLPGGNALTPSFEATPALSADVGNGGNVAGVSTSTDFVTLRYGLGAYADLNALLAALDHPDSSGALRVGLHVRGIPGSGETKSDAFVSANRVPEPEPTVIPVADGGSTMAFLGAGLIGLGLVRRRRE